MLTVQTIPFVAKPPLRLLGLTDASQREPDHDFSGFGWCRPAAVWLGASADPRVVESPLLLALHTPDDPDPRAPLTLEFWFEHDGQEVAVQVSWLRFMRERVVPLLGSESDVVVALCNPHRLPLLTELGGRRLHYAHGDVTAWLEPHDPDPPRLVLRADAWRVVS